MSLSVILLLRLLHIVIGVAWVGSIIFITFFLLPTLKAIGPASARVMEELSNVRKMPIYLMLVGMLTIVSGIALLWHDMKLAGPAFMASGPGRTFSGGGALAIIALMLGGAINAPAGKRLGVIAAAVRTGGGTPSADQTAEMGRLQTRLRGATKAAAVLLVLATAAMSVARYVP